MPAVVLVGERDVGRARRAPAPARARSCGRSRAGAGLRESRKRGSSPSTSWIAAKRSGAEQSSLTTQTQSVWVWARIESTWRRNSSSGGSQVVMQTATLACAATRLDGRPDRDDGELGLRLPAAARTVPAAPARAAPSAGRSARCPRTRSRSRRARWRAWSPAAASRTRRAAAPRRRRAASATRSRSPGAKHVPATNSAVPGADRQLRRQRGLEADLQLGHQRSLRRRNGSSMKR